MFDLLAAIGCMEGLVDPSSAFPLLANRNEISDAKNDGLTAWMSIEKVSFADGW